MLQISNPGWAYSPVRWIRLLTRWYEFVAFRWLKTRLYLTNALHALEKRTITLWTQQTQGDSEKLLSHLSQLSLLTIRQHGFLPRRSTVTNILSVEETVTQWFDEGDTVNIVYLGFTKAFNSVNFRLLLTKLKCYGIIRPSIN